MNTKSFSKISKLVAGLAVFSMALSFSIPSLVDANGKSTTYGTAGSTGGSYYTYTPVSSYSSPSSYYSYTPVSSYRPASTPSYSYNSPASSLGSYVAAPAMRYVQNAIGGGGGGGFVAPPQMSYTYTSNANSNKNTNTNTNSNKNTNTNTNNSTANAVNNNSNTFNPVNNNNISLVVVGGGSTPTDNTPAEPSLNGNCIITPSTAYINQNLTFMATASGGSGNYTYVWSGSDGISATGQSFTGRFASLGYKTAYVTITSGSQSITRNCNVLIQDNYVPPVNPPVNNISAYCVANPNVAYINQNVTWTMYINGYITSATTYQWSGTDGLYGNSVSTSRAYSYPGYKTANVIAYVNGQSVSATCSTTIYANTVASNVTVIRDQPPVTGVPVSGVFLNQVPATGIDFGPKMIMITLAMIAWSVIAGYAFYRYNKPTIDNRIAEFKRQNMLKKGIIA